MSGVTIAQDDSGGARGSEARGIAAAEGGGASVVLHRMFLSLIGINAPAFVVYPSRQATAPCRRLSPVVCRAAITRRVVAHPRRCAKLARPR